MWLLPTLPGSMEQFFNHIESSLPCASTTRRFWAAQAAGRGMQAHRSTGGLSRLVWGALLALSTCAKQTSCLSMSTDQTYSWECARGATDESKQAADALEFGVCQPSPRDAQGLWRQTVGDPATIRRVSTIFENPEAVRAPELEIRGGSPTSH